MSGCFGKYRGKVEDNADPKKLGRVRVSVPAVLGESDSSWAMPCVPYAGPKVGFFMIPPKGANIWVEFEDGDPDHPIWSGCFWGDGDTPKASAEAADKIIRTETCTLTLSDSSKSKGITLETKSGLKIIMDDDGIEINNGKKAVIKLDGKKVTVNKDGLEVS